MGDTMTKRELRAEIERLNAAVAALEARLQQQAMPIAWSGMSERGQPRRR